MVLLIRVPTATEYANKPYEERARLYAALKNLMAEWAETELQRLPA